MLFRNIYILEDICYMETGCNGNKIIIARRDVVLKKLLS